MREWYSEVVVVVDATFLTNVRAGASGVLRYRDAGTSLGDRAAMADATAPTANQVSDYIERLVALVSNKSTSENVIHYLDVLRPLAGQVLQGRNPSEWHATCCQIREKADSLAFELKPDRDHASYLAAQGFYFVSLLANLFRGLELPPNSLSVAVSTFQTARKLTKAAAVVAAGAPSPDWQAVEVIFKSSFGAWPSENDG